MEQVVAKLEDLTVEELQLLGKFIEDLVKKTGKKPKEVSTNGKNKA